ncbi:glycoside hydrolase family 16 protein [Yeosuana marina]|uniref:glycoside hydrolase family 16 protein n=1 Tax=Yeosuana marina TaxID=1565536 RepID=UPI0030C7E0B4|tara:strand:- start:11158 stop:12279 length:1122 start_codon:yes stop_codon:yes gene_type:complete
MKLIDKPISKILLLVFISLTNLSCSSSDSPPDDPIDNPTQEILPANLVLNVTVLNTDATNPNGDGSGKIQCTATADNAVKYGFIFGNASEIQNTTGTIDYTFTEPGTNNYTISVIAYSSTNNTVSTFKITTVYVTEPELQLVWSDEFDVDGSPNPNNWGYNIGTGSNGWGNGESQYYTDRSDNVIVEGGLLKITAKKESYSGSEYTSARLLTQGKYEFTYGRVDVRAKLPEGDGTWPAIWMLGANINTVGWPACGEIDIMEHWGYDPGKVHSATHTTACSGACTSARVGTTNLPDFSTAFHVYSIEWDKNEIRFLIDGVFKYKYAPATKTNDNYPYTANQFIILNVAMGGSWFTIDPNFTESTMEVDYVRVYQ